MKVNFKVIEVTASTRKHDAKLVLSIDDTVANDLMYWMCGLKDLTMKLDVEVEGAVPFEIKEAVNYKPDDAKGKPCVGYGVKDDVRSYNVGNSDYSKHKIQPWDIWEEYKLDPWDADIIKRILREKEGEDEELDYEKIIHICHEKIRQINAKKAKNNG